MMMKMTLQKVLKKVNITPGRLHHCALSEGKSAATQFDVVLCAQNFANMFKDAEKKGVKVIPLRNIMSVTGNRRETERIWSDRIRSGGRLWNENIH